MATITDKLDQLQAEREKRFENGLDAYMQLVRATAAGEEVDPGEAATTLDNFDRSCEALEKDAEVYTKRLGWKAVVDAAPEHDAKAAKLQAEIDQVSSERAETYAKLTRKMQALCLERDVSLNAGAAVGPAVGGLRETAWPHQIAERDAIQAELKSRCSGLGDLKRHVVGLEASLASSTRTLEQMKSGRAPQIKLTRKSHENQVASCNRQLNEARQRLEQLESVAEEITARLGQADKRLLEP